MKNSQKKMIAKSFCSIQWETYFCQFWQNNNKKAREKSSGKLFEKTFEASSSEESKAFQTP